MTMRKTSAWLILERGSNRGVRVVAVRQNDPALERGQRAIHVNLEIDDAWWTPQPSPSTTILVTAPKLPDIQVLVSELPQMPWPDEAAKRGHEAHGGITTP